MGTAADIWVQWERVRNIGGGLREVEYWYWQDDACFEPIGPFESRAEAIADMRECRPAPVDHADAITESLQRENDRRERHRLAVEAGEICECPVEGGCALCGGGEA